MGTGFAFARYRGEAPNPVKVKISAKEISENYRSPAFFFTSLKEEKRIFFSFQTRASHLRRTFVSNTAIHLVLNS